MTMAEPFPWDVLWFYFIAPFLWGVVLCFWFLLCMGVAVCWRGKRPK